MYKNYTERQSLVIQVQLYRRAHKGREFVPVDDMEISICLRCLGSEFRHLPQRRSINIEEERDRL
jgi:hypothetical protein